MGRLLKIQWTREDLRGRNIKAGTLSDTRASSHTKICWPECDLFQNNNNNVDEEPMNKAENSTG